MSDAKLIFGTMPIGNLDDATYNLINYIKKSDVIAVENEEFINKLIDHYQISTEAEIISISPKNFMQDGLVENKSGLSNSLKIVVDQILSHIASGKVVLCVSDEGSPIVTDPFIYLRQLAIAAGIKYDVLPGPSAIIAAISHSKLYAGKSFSFYGMVFYDPDKEYIYDSIKESRYSSVLFYHHEIQEKFLKELIDRIGPDRKATLTSDLTSKDQKVLDGTLSDILEFVLKNDVRQPTLVIAGKGKK